VSVLMAAVASAAESKGGDWLSNHSTLFVGVVGIVVSGILGPAVTMWLSRKSARQQFARDLIVARRDDLRRLADDAALLLGAGGTNLRLLHEADSRNTPPPAAASEWALSVFPLGQRLRLRLPEQHPVVKAYDDVRERLTEAQEAVKDAPAFSEALDRYEQARASFLDAARVAVEAPVDENTAS
jgi:hypothetical protein